MPFYTRGRGELLRYLSNEWMELVHQTVNYGKDHEFLVWLYDEDGFPSGFAGGRTIEPNLQDYSANFLVLEEQYECQGGEFIQIKVRLPNIDSSLYGILATPFQRRRNR